MPILWDYKTKKKLLEKVEEKLFSFFENEYNFRHLKHSYSISTCPMAFKTWKKHYKIASKYLDDLGCVRIVKTKISGWEVEDSKESEDPKPPWKSVNDLRYVHIKNPISIDKKEHLIRLPKEVAEKIMILGMP